MEGFACRRISLYYNIKSLDIKIFDIYLVCMVKTTQTKEYVEFVKKLKAARLEAGLTQVQVAKKLKRPQSIFPTLKRDNNELMLLNSKGLRHCTKNHMTIL
jgi:hypothetical protein